LTNNDGGIVVKEQVNVPISIGKYFEYVLFDTVPMKVGHIMLGMPWQYDNKILHDGYTNKITFNHKGSRITLIPLSPQQMRKDEIKLKMKRLKGKRIKRKTIEKNKSLR